MPAAPSPVLLFAAPPRPARTSVARGVVARLLVALAAFLALPAAAQATATISGTVVNESDEPVAGVRIDLYGVSHGSQGNATTADDGSFTIADVHPYADGSPTTYQVGVTSDDPLLLDQYANASGDQAATTVTVTDGGSASVEVTVHPAAILEGTARYVDGKVAPGVRVFTSGGRDVAITDAAGAFRFVKVEPGPNAINWGGGAGPGLVSYWPGVTDERDASQLELTPGGTTTIGIVVLTEGKPGGDSVPRYEGPSTLKPTAAGNLDLVFSCPVAAPCEAVVDVVAPFTYGGVKYEFPIGRANLFGESLTLTPNPWAKAVYGLVGRRLTAELRVAPLGATQASEIVTRTPLTIAG